MRRLAASLAFMLVSLAGCGASPHPGDTVERGRIEPERAKLEPVQAKPAQPAQVATPEPAVDLQARAEALAQQLLILDGHIDLPYRLTEDEREGRALEDVSQRTTRGDFDHVRAKAGGLDAPFMSIYTPAALEGQPGASKRHADSEIDRVERIIAAYPERFAAARSPAEVRANTLRGLISLPLGMENGSPIEHDLANLAHFYERGIRYITLAHSRDNHISDSSYSQARTHKGLSAFGREVVAEMNRLGIMIDIAHVSDDAFMQVLELSAAPVIASHSSCRHFTPGWERNVSDEMLVALAAKRGVIQINFGSEFISDEYRLAVEQGEKAIERIAEEHGLNDDSPEREAKAAQYWAAHPLPEVRVEQVADHIDHVVAVAGIDHVGLGSDFDGVGAHLPVDLRDVSMYPNLIRVLLERGYSEADIAKIAGENVLRVWQAVEDHAAGTKVGSPHE